MLQRNFAWAFLFLFSFHFNAFAVEHPVLISGFDDVLRQAENTGLLKAGLKIFEKDKTFTGMPELYQAMTFQEPDPQFTLISGISNWFDSRIQKFLKESHYPTQRRYLRNWLTELDLEGFKVSKVDSVIAGHPGRQFVVIFDNSEASLSLADKLSAKYPDKIKAIYLRQTIEKKVPPSARSFYTAFDIAAMEFSAGRLSIEDLRLVADAILKESNLELLIPSYASCPVHYTPCMGLSGMDGTNEICANVQKRVQDLCSHRK